MSFDPIFSAASVAAGVARKVMINKVEAIDRGDDPTRP
jgi:hypothetical protein